MATVKQYAAWCEKRIAATVVGEGLQCGLLGVVQGPLTITYRVRLMQPAPAALKRLLGMGDALAQALQVAAVRLTQAPGAILIEIPLPVEAHRTPTASELARHTQRLRVAVGYDAMRRPVHVDLRQHGALFWIGPSRRGKTQSMKSTLYALARANAQMFRYVILSQKRADWRAFEPAAGCMGVVSDPAEALDVLQWAAALLQGRAETGTGGAAFVIVADDLLNLLSAEPDLAAPLAEIASMGAGLGVHLLAGTQEGGSKRGTGGAGVENNATARILYRSSSAAAGARAAGQGGAGLEALSSAKGDALLLVDGESVRVATGMADDREIALLPASMRVVAPWRGATTATTAPPAATGDHQWQPAQPATAHPTEQADAGSGEGDAAPPVAVVETAATVAARTFPIARRPASAAEAEVIRQLAASGESLNSLCRIVYGGKDGKALAWVKEALSGAPGGESIDLATDEGKAAMRAPLANRQIDWHATSEQIRRDRLLN